MAGEVARDNGRRLEARLGRVAGAADLYMAHFLGAGGAAQFLTALAASPDAPAATIAPAAARANHAVFFSRDGHARSLADVYQRFAAKFGDGSGDGGAVPMRRNTAPVVLAAVPGAAVAPAAVAPAAAARAAYMLLAELGG